VLAAIIWFAVWVFQQKSGRVLSVPKLSMLLASVNLVIGGILGSFSASRSRARSTPRMASLARTPR
jgi:hypothetical protein